VVIDPSFLALAGRRSGGRVPRGLVGITRVLEPLVELCRSSGCAVLVVHQSRPPRYAGHPATLDDAAGSGFAELAQQWLLVSRRRSFDPGSGQHELWLTTGNRVGESALWELDVEEAVWKTALQPVASAGVLLDEQRVATRQDAQARRSELAFLRQCRRAHDLLAAHPGGMSARRMRDMLGMSGERITRVLDWLLENGLMNFGTLGGSRATDRYSWASPWPDLAVSNKARRRGTAPGRGTAPAPGAAGAECDGVLPAAADPSAPESVGRDTSGAESGRDTSVECEQQAGRDTQEPSPRPSPSGLGEGEETGRDSGAEVGRDTSEANGGTDQPTAEE
jgi:hypothetical protein